MISIEKLSGIENKTYGKASGRWEEIGRVGKGEQGGPGEGYICV